MAEFEADITDNLLAKWNKLKQDDNGNIWGAMLK